MLGGTAPAKHRLLPSSELERKLKPKPANPELQYETELAGKPSNFGKHRVTPFVRPQSLLFCFSFMKHRIS
jgi:hypothetical protein